MAGVRCPICKIDNCHDFNQYMAFSAKSFADGTRWLVSQNALELSRDAVKSHCEKHINGWIPIKERCEADLNPTPEDLQAIKTRLDISEDDTPQTSTAKALVAAIENNMLGITRNLERYAEGKSPYPDEAVKGLRNLIECGEKLGASKDDTRYNKGLLDDLDRVHNKR